ncbi:cobalt-precorrin-6A reductase [Profundibacter sp.]
MKLLLLAGTSEARKLAISLADEPRIKVIASLAGVTREPLDLPVPMRKGGFGGRAAFREYLRDQAFDAVVDGTHPFAAKISKRCCEVAREMDLPHLQILRPEWQPEAGDLWTFIADESKAAGHIPQGATVFLATGRQTLHRFGNMTGRKLICRQIDSSEGEFPFEGGEYLIGRPPFSIEEEVELFTRRKVDWLVVKNAGGMLSRSKLVAARQLRIPVLLINRPPVLECARVETAEAALDWVRGLL